MKHFAVVALATLSVYILASCTEGAKSKCMNERPIIGILAQALTNKKIKNRFPFTEGRSFIPASYVKWIEASGARVLPIKENLSPTKLTELLHSINGVVFPGGISSLSTSKYAKNGRIIFDYAIQAKKSGKIFPVFGICLGFQLLTVLVSGRNLLQRTYSSRVSLKVDFTNAVDSSAMFADLNPKMKMLATNRPLAFNNHRWGIYKGTFGKGLLKKFFKLLAISKDRKGVEFVAAIEGNYIKSLTLRTLISSDIFLGQKTSHVQNSLQFETSNGQNFFQHRKVTRLRAGFHNNEKYQQGNSS